MAIINSASLRAKVGAFIGTAEGAAKFVDSAQVDADLNTLATLFTQNMIGCASAASGVASNFGLVGKSVCNSGKSMTATLTFEFGNKHRDSLAPDRYDGIDNIVALFNNGYSASNQVRGMWHGRMVRSLQSRAGLHFVVDAANSFNGYNVGCATVTGVDVDGIYK